MPSDTGPPFRRGEQLQCPACGKDSVVQVRTKLEGWRNLGDWFVCGLCGHYLAALSEDARTDEAAQARETQAASRLAAFLNEEVTSSAPVGLLPDAEAAFCRDCLHFFQHPFVSRCLLHDRVTEPMHDCREFLLRHESEEQEEESET